MYVPRTLYLVLLGTLDCGAGDDVSIRWNGIDWAYTSDTALAMFQQIERDKDSYGAAVIRWSALSGMHSEEMQERNSEGVWTPVIDDYSMRHPAYRAAVAHLAVVLSGMLSKCFTFK